MSDYTVTNLNDVEDSAVQFGFSHIGEARFARGPLGAERTGLAFHRIKPGMRQAFGHRHEEAEEVAVVLAGSGRVKIEDEVVELKQWDAVRVANGTMRNFEAGPEGAEIIAIGAPIGERDSEIVQG